MITPRSPKLLSLPKRPLSARSIMMLACGTGAWRVRSSMNELSELMHITCTVDIGLMSINYTCFDGEDSFSQSLCLTNTGVNTSQLNRLEKFVLHFSEREITQSCEKIHSALDKIEEIHGLYTPPKLAIAAALACGAFTFLLGGGLVEMLCAFAGAGIGNYIDVNETVYATTNVNIRAFDNASCDKKRSITKR